MGRRDREKSLNATLLEQGPREAEQPDGADEQNSGRMRMSSRLGILIPLGFVAGKFAVDYGPSWLSYPFALCLLGLFAYFALRARAVRSH